MAVSEFVCVKDRSGRIITITTDTLTHIHACHHFGLGTEIIIFFKDLKSEHLEKEKKRKKEKKVDQKQLTCACCFSDQSFGALFVAEF